MDAGCEFSGYSCDITRTWPVNGKFSNLQKRLYEIVLRVQLLLIEVTFHIHYNASMLTNKVDYHSLQIRI